MKKIISIDTNNKKIFDLFYGICELKTPLYNKFKGNSKEFINFFFKQDKFNEFLDNNFFFRF